MTTTPMATIAPLQLVGGPVPHSLVPDGAAVMETMGNIMKKLTAIDTPEVARPASVVCKGPAGLQFGSRVFFATEEARG